MKNYDYDVCGYFIFKRRKKYYNNKLRYKLRNSWFPLWQFFREFKRIKYKIKAFLIINIWY